jgi:hypothetical protein
METWPHPQVGVATPRLTVDWLLKIAEGLLFVSGIH